MKSIYKYLIDGPGTQKIEMHKDAQILSAQIQHNDQMVLWALVDLNAPMVERVILMLVTGGGYRGHLGKHIATIQHFFGADYLVFHIFDGGESQ